MEDRDRQGRFDEVEPLWTRERPQAPGTYVARRTANGNGVTPGVTFLIRFERDHVGRLINFGGGATIDDMPADMEFMTHQVRESILPR